MNHKVSSSFYSREDNCFNFYVSKANGTHGLPFNIVWISNIRRVLYHREARDSLRKSQHSHVFGTNPEINYHKYQENEYQISFYHSRYIIIESVV